MIKRLLAFALALTFGLTSAHADLTTNLVAHWPFEGNGNDVSGNGYNLSGSNSPTYATGLVGQAADLEASTNQYFQIATLAALDSQSAQTHILLVNFESLTDFQNAGIKRSSDNLRFSFGLGGTSFGTNTSFLAAVSNGSNAYAYTPASQFTTGQWYFWVVVFDGSQGTATDRVRFYKGDSTSFNTTPVAWTSTTGTFPTTTPNIGATAAWVGRQSAGNIDGLIDEYYIFNRALSTSDMQEAYDLAFPPPGESAEVPIVVHHRSLHHQ